MFYILTREDCSYCDKAKNLLRERGVPFGAFHYLSHPIILPLMKKSGMSTVPQIWEETPIGKMYIGGYDDLVDYFSAQDNDNVDWIDS